jgi:DNA-binding NarL/FixJ family response regulator
MNTQSNVTTLAAIDPQVVPCVMHTHRRVNPLDRLTCRERQVLALVAEGYSNAAIAELLNTTSRTVETHTSRIFSKLDLEATPTTHRRVLAALTHLHAGGVRPSPVCHCIRQSA